jgi:hypothetical protein
MLINIIFLIFIYFTPACKTNCCMA